MDIGNPTHHLALAVLVPVVLERRVVGLVWSVEAEAEARRALQKMGY